jgi:hypothetical protein
VTPRILTMPTVEGKYEIWGEGRERHVNKLNPSVLSQLTIILNSLFLCYHLSDTHKAYHFPFFLDIMNTSKV